MAGRAMSRSIAASIVRFVIGANGIVRADLQPLQGVSKDGCDPGRGRHEAAERPLCAGAGGVNQHAAAVKIASPSSS